MLEIAVVAVTGLALVLSSFRLPAGDWSAGCFSDRVLCCSGRLLAVQELLFYLVRGAISQRGMQPGVIAGQLDL